MPFGPILDVGNRAKELFRLAVEACPSGIIIVDGAGLIVLANVEIERLFGYRREELIDRPVDILLPEQLRALHSRHRQNFSVRPQTRHVGEGRDLIGRRNDGTEFPVEIGLNPIRIDDELLVLSTVTDISERKRLERLKDEFVATVSHELRTPMTSIAGALGLIMGNAADKLPNSTARLLAIAHRNCLRLVRLVNNVLDIGKLESGQTIFDLQAVEILPAVRREIEANRGFAEVSGVQVRLDALSAAGEVHADPDRLAQVITNLLSNAIKFSPKGKDVEVTIERRGEDFRISVRDHGPGISEDFKPRIFGKFAQADATDERQHGGTGLGLSIVKQIVTRLGGRVGFDEVPGGGTSFYVELPAMDASATHELAVDGKRTAEGPQSKEG
jgi:PAS domain S-box-containing protein